MSNTRINKQQLADEALYETVNDIADEIDSSVVHLTGHETIEGNKTFTGYNNFTTSLKSSGFVTFENTSPNVEIINSTLDKNLSTVTKRSAVSFLDKNDNLAGFLMYGQEGNGKLRTFMGAYNLAGTAENVIEVGYKNNGTEAYTSVMTPTEDTTTSTQIDSVGARNTKLLTKQDVSSSVNYNNITNCITEIPQDIKLELNDGTLTLKAGSKVYYNGSPIIIDSDKSYTAPTTFPTVPFIISVNPTESLLLQATVENTSSSASNPGTGYTMWFNTSDRNCYINDGSANATMCSYPICTVNCTNGTGFTSIDQVFNGFGYIGSTVFALPGVKGLIPNGRNEDGSLNSIMTSDYSNVKTVQVNPYTSKIAMYENGGLGTQTANFRLKEQENYNYDTNTLTRALEIAGVNVDSSSKITSFTAKTAFHATDYNDFSDLNDKVVHKSGDETIAGNKTFTGTATFSKANDTRIIAKASDVTRGSAPANNSFSGVVFRDKNNSELAAIYSRYNTAGEVASLLYVKSPVSDSTANIRIGVTADGAFYTYAPTPASTSNDTSIATTAWVRSFAPYLKTTYVNGTSGYRIWSDGYCEQWGYLYNNTSTKNTITFIKKYKSNPVVIRQNLANDDTNNSGVNFFMVNSVSTSSFTAYTYNRAGLNSMYWIAYGYLANGQY